MTLTTHIKARSRYTEVQVKVRIKTKLLIRDESRYEQAKTNDALFNALRQLGYHTQDIELI